MYLPTRIQGMTDAQSAETVAVPSETLPPPAKTRVHAPGAVGVHISGVGCRATVSISPERVWVGSVTPGDVQPVVESIVNAVLTVEPHPKFVVVGTPGHVNGVLGTVTAAANLGQEWRGTVALAELLRSRLDCEVELCNDAEAALEGERRRGALVACNDGALITLSHGVGVALLHDGIQQPTELGHSVSQFGGPECRGRPHRGCYESYLGGWALPIRYRERHPDFDGVTAREIPDDHEFWTECGRRLGDLIVGLCLLGQPLEAISFIGSVAQARHHYLLPGVRARVDEEAALLVTRPRSLRVTPLGDDVSVLGAFLMARDLLHPFLAA